MCLYLKERNKIDKNRREIIWKTKKKINIKWYIILFDLREIGDK